jgi:hypothetical protein
MNVEGTRVKFSSTHPKLNGNHSEMLGSEVLMALSLLVEHFGNWQHAAMEPSKI